MGTVDIEQTVEEVLQGNGILWNGEPPSFVQMEGIVRDVVTRVTEGYYPMNEGRTDNWDVQEL